MKPLQGWNTARSLPGAWGLGYANARSRASVCAPAFAVPELAPRSFQKLLPVRALERADSKRFSRSEIEARLRP
jgi:hypothetical protein